jgi:membrane-associated phospholipid phosphatase
MSPSLRFAFGALLAGTPVFGQLQSCTNDVYLVTADPDSGCNVANPVCVWANGMMPGYLAKAEKCVPCVRTDYHNLAVDTGCSAGKPHCVMDDGVNNPSYNYAGTKCVGDEPALDSVFDPVPGDLGIRFSKFSFVNGNVAPAGFFPLYNDVYPMIGDVCEILQDKTNAVSVVPPGDFELHGAESPAFIHACGGLPSMPNADSNHDFWNELEHVVDMQIHRRQSGNLTPQQLTLPLLWSGMDIHAVAEAVHDEYPGYHQQKLLEWLWAAGVAIDYDILPFRSNSDFIGNQIRLADLNTWAIRIVSPINFHLKWQAGRPRPEEVAYMISTGDLTTGVRDSLKNKIDGMNLTEAPEFTAYAEGCPRHPSWPAMHSAASSASLWLSVVLNLKEDQYCEALRVDYAVAYARTVAGVHYPSDNTVGLNLGQIIIAENLADYLAEAYGSDRDKVQAKIKSKLVDWKNFDSSTCTFTSI